MTKCVMREFETLGPSVVGNTLKEAKKIVKESCKHPGGILAPDECIKNFISKKNESKHFVCTNDEDLRNDLRNLGTVPIFFFKHNILVMDSPTEITEEKHKMKEQLKNEPTRQEKKFFKDQRFEINEFLKQEREKEALKRREQVKDLYCMGIKTKLAKGPNPLSVKKKKHEDGKLLTKRRKRTGKRSKQLNKENLEQTINEEQKEDLTQE